MTFQSVLAVKNTSKWGGIEEVGDLNLTVHLETIKSADHMIKKKN